MTKFVELKGKAHSHLIDDGSKDKKSIGTKECDSKA